MTDGLIKVQVVEVGVDDAAVTVPIGLNLRPVIIIEFFPDADGSGQDVLTVGHGGFNGEIKGARDMATLLRETADVLDMEGTL